MKRENKNKCMERLFEKDLNLELELMRMTMSTTIRRQCM